MKSHRSFLSVFVAAALLGACSSEVTVDPPDDPPDDVTPITTSLELQDDMRVLWTQHVLWTRVVIISSIAGLGDGQVATDRLLMNQDHIGDAIRPFYGDAAGDQLSVLLREHITIALDVVYGASIGDPDAAIAAWFVNADEIARFLADANPNWSFEEMQAMMHLHLDQTIVEATARLEGDWDADIAAYDEVVMHALDMADMLAGGIEQQFPRLVAPSTTSPSEDALHRDMRVLWEDHVMWTRIFIIASVAGLPDAGFAGERLLRNQDDIGDAIRPVYGDAAGDELSRLLREHITIAADVVYNASIDDGPATQAALGAWVVNADEIATFLAGANPHWAFEDLQDMMHTHLDQTAVEATARLTGDWAGDAAIYDEIELHILHMADVMSDGISAQFPSP